MKAYYRISVATTEQHLKVASITGNMANNRYFTLTAIDFGGGIINMRDNNEYEANKERIEHFFENENKKIVMPKLYELDIMSQCDNDNIVLVDLVKPEIHIGYADDFFNKKNNANNHI